MKIFQQLFTAIKWLSASIFLSVSINSPSLAIGAPKPINQCFSQNREIQPIVNGISQQNLFDTMNSICQYRSVSQECNPDFSWETTRPSSGDIVYNQAATTTAQNIAQQLIDLGLASNGSIADDFQMQITPDYRQQLDTELSNAGQMVASTSVLLATSLPIGVPHPDAEHWVQEPVDCKNIMGFFNNFVAGLGRVDDGVHAYWVMILFQAGRWSH